MGQQVISPADKDMGMRAPNPACHLSMDELLQLFHQHAELYGDDNGGQPGWTISTVERTAPSGTLKHLALWQRDQSHLHFESKNALE